MTTGGERAGVDALADAETLGAGVAVVAVDFSAMILDVVLQWPVPAVLPMCVLVVVAPSTRYSAAWKNW